MKFILIMFLATTSNSNSGTGGIAAEFNSKQACEAAGRGLYESSYERGNYVLTYGCFPK
jgi:hypothetical protein